MKQEHKTQHSLSRSLLSLSPALLVIAMIIYAAVRQDPMHQRPTVPSLAVTEAIEALPDSTPTAKNSEEDPSLRSIELVLSDPFGRISPEFRVPKSLKRRVGFWFDIYTKYSKNHHVIHDSKYPWLVYEVVDTNPILDGPGHFWTRYHKAKKIVTARKQAIRKAIRSLSKRSNYRGLSKDERLVYRLLRSVGGRRKQVFTQASSRVRSQLGQKDFFEEGLHHSGQFMPYMKQIFAEQGLPVELTALPFVESSFNIEAESKVGASGIWQIMPSSAKETLIVKKQIDERNNPIKATEYAAFHLKRNYRLAKGNWALAILGYNHGIGSVRNAMRKLDTDNFVTILNDYKARSFGFASKNFYPCFLAALHAYTYAEQIFPDVKTKSPLDISIAETDQATSLSEFAENALLPVDILLDLNPDMEHHETVLPAGFRLVIPKQTEHLLRSTEHLTQRWNEIQATEI